MVWNEQQKECVKQLSLSIVLEVGAHVLAVYYQCRIEK
jgi:hypothetical protein